VTYIIAEPCIDIKDKSCVDVCPVDCIHEANRILVIDPEECIDCTLCEPECPANVIFPEDDVPAGQERFRCPGSTSRSAACRASRPGSLRDGGSAFLLILGVQKAVRSAHRGGACASGDAWNRLEQAPCPHATRTDVSVELRRQPEMKATGSSPNRTRGK